MKIVSLRSLFDAGRLWQGKTSINLPVTKTGHPSIDQTLASGGWPAHMLIELLTDQHLQLPMQFVLPAWQKYSGAKWLACVNPPYQPCTEGLLQAGLDITRFDVIQTQPKDTAWCLEQICRSSVMHSVLVWNKKSFTPTQLRRLQLACQHGKTQLFLIRNLYEIHHASPAPVRVKLISDTTRFSVEIIKQPGAGPCSPIHVETDLCWVKKLHPTRRKTFQFNTFQALH